MGPEYHRNEINCQEQSENIMLVCLQFVLAEYSINSETDGEISNALGDLPIYVKYFNLRVESCNEIILYNWKINWAFSVGFRKTNILPKKLKIFIINEWNEWAVSNKWKCFMFRKRSSTNKWFPIRHVTTATGNITECRSLANLPTEIDFMRGANQLLFSRLGDDR